MISRLNKTAVCALALGLFAWVWAAPAAGPAQADDAEARAIMEKVEARDDGDDMTADMEMILVDKNGARRERVLRSFSKDKGQDTLRLMFFLEPADVEGTAFLTYDYDDPDRDDDQWIYLPALRKTKRIASNDKDNPFMGSDFSYADMTDRSIENYTYKLLKEVEVRGNRCWLIESTPRTEHIVEMYGYTKSAAFVRQDNYVVVRAVHWVQEGGRLKYMDVVDLKEIDGIWQPLEVTMTTKKGRVTEHSTIMRWKDVRFNQDLDEEMFTIRRMEKGL